MTHPEIVEPQWFIPMFIGGWIAVCCLLSLIGGWYVLGQQYPASETVEGKTFRMVSGSIGWRLFPVNYGNCLFVTVNSSGFGLRVLFLFRVLHVNLYFPWDTIESVDVQRYAFWVKRTRISVRGFNRYVTLIGKAGLEIADAYKRYQSSRI